MGQVCTIKIGTDFLDLTRFHLKIYLSIKLYVLLKKLK